jgi:hypothetical protein
MVYMMLEQEIKIPASPGGGYPIRIGTEILGSLWPQIEADFAKYSKFVVTDENLVSAGHLQKLLGQRDIPAFVISPAGETSKNIDTAVSIIEAMEKAYLGRDTSPLAAERSVILPDSQRPYSKEACRSCRYRRQPWHRPIRLSAEKPA